MQSPPGFELPSFLLILDAILGDDTEPVLSADLMSWFVQLQPHPEIARWFCCRTSAGYFVLLGLPFGWSFAPIIAQTVTTALVRRASALFRRRHRRQICPVIVYDNIVTGLPP